MGGDALAGLAVKGYAAIATVGALQRVLCVRDTAAGAESLQGERRGETTLGLYHRPERARRRQMPRTC